MNYTITQVHNVLRNYRSIFAKKNVEMAYKESPKETQGTDKVNISKEALEKLNALVKVKAAPQITPKEAVTPKPDATPSPPALQNLI